MAGQCRSGHRDELIAAAHAGIIGDVLRDAHYRALLGALVPGGLPAAVPDGPVPDTEVAAVIAAIKENYRIPPPPDAQAQVELATRAARVADGVAKGLPATPGPLAPVRTWAGRIVHVAAGLVELALPNRVSSILGRHLLDVALIAGVLIIVLGGLVGGPGVTSFGWVVVLTVLGVRLVARVARSWLAHGRWKLGVAAAGCAGRRPRRLRARCRGAAGRAGRSASPPRWRGRPRWRWPTPRPSTPRRCRDALPVHTP